MRRWFSYLELFISQVGIGVSVVLAKQLLLLDVKPVIQIQFRFICTILFLLALLIPMAILNPSFRKSLFQIQYSLKEWGLLTIQALCAGIFFNFFMLLGLKYTTATMAGIIGSALPAIIAILSWLMLKESLTTPKKQAILFAMFGMLILHLDTLENGSANNAFIGNSLVFCALIPEALYTIIAKRLAGRMNTLLQAIMLNFISAITFLPIWILNDGLQSTLSMPWLGWQFLLISSFCSAIFYFCWTDAVPRVKVSTAGLFTGIMPISATCIAIMLLGEHFTLYDFIGISFVLVSIFYGTKQENLPLPNLIHVSERTSFQNES